MFMQTDSEDCGGAAPFNHVFINPHLTALAQLRCVALGLLP